jgi:hypothetical protein
LFERRLEPLKPWRDKATGDTFPKPDAGKRLH